ncbi:MAG: response regulator, partial [Candidatus Omnitrophota bacterium]
LISEVGYDAQTVATGSIALERLERERPSCIIINDGDKEDSGLRLARKIRNFDKEIKIIMLGSHFEDEATKKELESLGVAAYLKDDFHESENIKKMLMALKSERIIKPDIEEKRGKILIVDDEPDSCRMMGNFLRRRGFEVEVAYSGEECLAKIPQHNFDVILLDITMKNMDGLLTLKRIKDVNPKIKVVMVTALANDEVLSQAKLFGASDYITKPFDFSVLESSLLTLFLSKKD